MEKRLAAARAEAVAEAKMELLPEVEGALSLIQELEAQRDTHKAEAKAAEQNLLRLEEGTAKAISTLTVGIRDLEKEKQGLGEQVEALQDECSQLRRQSKVLAEHVEVATVPQPCIRELLAFV